jgi:hypothetical protein
MNLSNYITYAMNEFQAAGWVDSNGKWSDSTQQAMCEHVMDLLRVFGDEGHSGTTAPYAINLFSKLAKFEPITPLTGDDSEWNEISDECTDEVSVYQNKRCGAVFKQSNRFDGKPYYLEAVVFWDWHTDSETGRKFKSYYTSGDSARVIEFPYTPTTEYIYAPDTTT